MFKYRIISFPVLLGLVALIVFWENGGPWIFWLLSGVCGYMLARELSGLFAELGIGSYGNLAGALCGVVTLLFFPVVVPAAAAVASGIIIFCPTVFWLLVLFFGKRREMIKKVLFSAVPAMLSCAIIFPIVLIFYICAAAVDGYSDYGLGMKGLLFFVLVTKAMDTGGYIFGMLSARLLPGGNHKIAPSISPKKSWEGFFGGMALCVLVSWLLWDFCLGERLATPANIVIAGVILGVGSFAGDLTESALKRACGVKDSGHWIPGMGGIFDVLDSFIYNGMIFLIWRSF